MTVEDQASENFNEKEWLQKEHGNVLSYCSRNVMSVSNIIQPESAILPPVVAVWLVEIKENAQQVWVITGDVPHDHIPYQSAKNAREALKNFSLRWQLQAENILNELEENQSTEDFIEKQKSFAELLVSRAEGLYELAEKEEYWANK